MITLNTNQKIVSRLKRLRQNLTPYYETFPELSCILKLGYLTGGCFASYARRENRECDLDIYLRSGVGGLVATLVQIHHKEHPNSIKIPVANAQKWLSQWNGMVTFDDGLIRCITPHAITLVGNVQIIHAWSGSPDDVLNRFDFNHLRAWVHLSSTLALEQTYYMDKTVLEDILVNRARYIHSDYPLSSLFRMKKLISRDWHVGAGDMIALAVDLAKVDFTSINVLKKQMVGIDLETLMDIVRAITNKHGNEGNLTNKELFDFLKTFFG